MATSTNYYPVSNGGSIGFQWYLTQTDTGSSNLGRIRPITYRVDPANGTVEYFLSTTGLSVSPASGEVASPLPVRVETGSRSATVGSTVVSSLAAFTHSSGAGAIVVPNHTNFARVHVKGADVAWISVANGSFAIGSSANRTSDGGYIELQTAAEIDNFQVYALSGDAELYIEFANKE